MKRKETTHSFLIVKKKKIDDDKSALAELLLLYESGRDVKHLTACKFLASCSGKKFQL